MAGPSPTMTEQSGASRPSPRARHDQDHRRHRPRHPLPDLAQSRRVGRDESRSGLFRRLCGAEDRPAGPRRARPHLHPRPRHRAVRGGGGGAGAGGDRAHSRRHHRRHGHVLAQPHRVPPAALGRAGEGRAASRDRRGGERDLGPVGQGGGQAGVAPGRRPHARGIRAPDRLPLHHRRADAGRSARHPARQPGEQGHAHRRDGEERLSRPTPRPPAGSAIPTTRCGA